MSRNRKSSSRRWKQEGIASHAQIIARFEKKYGRKLNRSQADEFLRRHVGRELGESHYRKVIRRLRKKTKTRGSR